MPQVRLHYWAGARAAAGTDVETWTADSVAAALEAARAARADAGFDRVLGMCAVLVNGVTWRGERLQELLIEPVEVHVLPPYAGG